MHTVNAPFVAITAYIFLTFLHINASIVVSASTAGATAFAFIVTKMCPNTNNHNCSSACASCGYLKAHDYTDNGDRHKCTVCAHLEAHVYNNHWCTVCGHHQPPAPQIIGAPSSSIPEGTTISFSSTMIDPDPVFSFNYEWKINSTTSGSGESLNFEFADNGLYMVTLTVTDNNGGIGETSVEIEVSNISPTTQRR
ncbi:MAG: PKD domain protein [Pelotomaculum sp. PtaB.Bin104]|nr:MAG: PKD domain protein [Pelotomaculum sp. PtaB.Bin104]